MVDSVLEVQNIKTTNISPQKDIVTTDSGTGNVTVKGNVVVPDGGTIGSASDTDAITIDSSGNVGIGTTNPSATLHIKSSSGNIRLEDADDVNGSFSIIRSDAGGSLHFEADEGDSTANSTIRFSIDNTEHMRIDSSGSLLLGTTTIVDANGAQFVNAYVYPKTGSEFRSNSTSEHSAFIFRNSNGKVGSINTNGSSTSYNTSSDYRLKEDWQPMTGSTDRLKTLKPVNFAWKVDGSRVDGFLAHEAAVVVPEAVTGEKDAVDAEGNPEYQGIDQSKLVPLLTAALQEAVSKIEALTARIEVLENAAG